MVIQENCLPREANIYKKMLKALTNVLFGLLPLSV